MTQHRDLFAALAAPIDPSQIKHRSQHGNQLPYITARTAMNRLDNVLGPENWWDRFVPGEKSVLCELTIRLPDGSTLTKSDAGGYAGMADSGDDDKSGYSDAFKRAAVKFGVARYLYGDGVPDFAQGDHQQDQQPTSPPPPRRPEGRDQQRGQWGNKPRSEPAQNGRRSDAGGSSSPRTGKALWAWICEQEERGARGLKAHLADFAQQAGWPDRCFRWDGRQVAEAHAEARRYLSGGREQSSDRY